MKGTFLYFIMDSATGVVVCEVVKVCMLTF